MDKLYLHFTQCFPLDYHQQHRIGCFLTFLSTTLLVVTLPPLTRFIFILICTWIGFSYVTPQTTFLPFLITIQIHFTIVFPFLLNKYWNLARYIPILSLGWFLLWAMTRLYYIQYIISIQSKTGVHYLLSVVTPNVSFRCVNNMNYVKAHP